MHERDLNAAKERVEGAERSIVAAQNSLEQHRTKVLVVEKALQERRAQLEQLHRLAAAEATHGAEATAVHALLPDDLTKLVSPDERVSLRRATDLYVEGLRAAAKEAAAPLPKLGMEVDEFGSLNDEDDPITEERIQAHIDELLQAQTRGDPDKLAELRAQMARPQFTGTEEETDAWVAPPTGAMQRSQS